MAFPDSFIHELKLNNPIDSVMSSYVALIRRGRNYVCLCPFHSEKTPSCSVKTDDISSFFHCFGCGAGGDVITFIMKIENLDYIEAVKFLADRAGMTVPDDAENSQAAYIKSRILEMNRIAARFFYDVLSRSPDGEKGRRYFAERQLSNSTVIKYGLGYAPNDWHRLADYMHSKGYSDSELVAANLCDNGRNGRVYDRFRDRVMFPIIDLRGNVIAFGGRTIDGDGAKYLNTSDTPVFKKSRNLFSLNFAKKSGEKRLILAEGYMDVISINQAGIENAVATLGTALTQEQARLMSRYAEEVIISYDSDEAGQKATHKAINLLSEVGLRTRILKMENAKDPDEYIKKFGALRFRKLMDNSGGAMDFEFARCREGLDMDSDEGKITFLKRAVRLLADISSPIEREVYVGRASAEAGINREIISQQINNEIRKRIGADKNREWTNIRTFRNEMSNDPASYRHSKEYKAETGIIAFLAAYPEEAGYVISRISPDRFVTDLNRKIYEAIIQKAEKSAFSDILSLQSEFTADEMGKITEIVINNKDVNINKTAVDEFVKFLTERADNTVRSDQLSDDEFQNYFNSLRNKK